MNTLVPFARAPWDDERVLENVVDPRAAFAGGCQLDRFTLVAPLLAFPGPAVALHNDRNQALYVPRNSD